MQRQTKVISVILLMGIGAGAAFFFPSVQLFMKTVWRLFAALDVNAMLDYLRGFGPWAAAVSFLLMIFQALIAPLPAFMITFANAALFGWWQGAILSWSSAMVAAALCFMLSRWLGRDIVEKIVSPGALTRSDRFFQRYGKYAILICRLLPFVSFDIVSYAAGLTSIKLWVFLIATGLGQLPATLIYSYVGGALSQGGQIALTGILVFLSLAICIYVMKRKSFFIHKDQEGSDK